MGLSTVPEGSFACRFESAALAHRTHRYVIPGGRYRSAGVGRAASAASVSRRTVRVTSGDGARRASHMRKFGNVTGGAHRSDVTGALQVNQAARIQIAFVQNFTD